MTETTCVDAPSTATARPDDPTTSAAAARVDAAGVDAAAVDAAAVDAAEGWQALALAVHGTPLMAPELAAARLLPVDVALDLLFPDLDDAARHEAMWALDLPIE